jgi:small subunit ribosomal protein S18
MASKKNRARTAREANPRKIKKKTSPLVIEKVEYIDYKDVDLLQRFMSDRAKVRNRRVTGNSMQQQREVANAIKIAREMALLPYAKRVASTRTGGGRRGPDRDGGPRGDGGNDRAQDNRSDDAAESAADDVAETESED